MNHLFILLVLPSVILILSYLYQTFWRKESVGLLVGVLSSRDNFNERQIIRETWAKLETDLSTKIIFVLGNKDCPIHPDHRLSVFSCDPIELNEALASRPVSTSNSTLNSSQPYCGFSFQVHVEINIQEIGCFTAKESCSFTLTDVYTNVSSIQDSVLIISGI